MLPFYLYNMHICEASVPIIHVETKVAVHCVHKNGRHQTHGSDLILNQFSTLLILTDSPVNLQ